MRFIFSGKTDVGKTRSYNEDHFIIGSDLEKNRWEFNDQPVVHGKFGALLVIADGTGGINASGESISEPAVHAVAEKFRKLQRLPENDAEARQILQMTILEAHQTVLQKARQTAVYKDPSSTLLVAWILNGKAHIAWCGDSRAYLFRGQYTEQLTDDHTIVWQLVQQNRLTKEQARLHPHSHILTQCIGHATLTPQPDALTVRLKEEDRLVLTSDGVHSMIEEKDILSLVSYYDTPSACCKGLVDASNHTGGHDNITAIVVDVISEMMAKEHIKRSSRSIKSDVVKIRVPDDNTALESPKDALIAAILIGGFLTLFLFGFVFTNQIMGGAEVPEPINQRVQENVGQLEKNVTTREKLPLLPQGKPLQVTKQKPVTEAINKPTKNQKDSIDNKPNDAGVSEQDVQRLKNQLMQVLDQKDIIRKRINLLKNKTLNQKDKKLLKEAKTYFSKLYPKLKTITNAQSALNAPKSSVEKITTQNILQECEAVLQKITQILKKLE